MPFVVDLIKFRAKNDVLRRNHFITNDLIKDYDVYWIYVIYNSTALSIYLAK